MKTLLKAGATLAAVAFLSSPAMANNLPDGASLFQAKCKMCHALNKEKVGPMVIEMTDEVVDLKAAIIEGKRSMPKFGNKLSGAEIDALTLFIQETQLDPEAGN